MTLWRGNYYACQDEGSQGGSRGKDKRDERMERNSANDGRMKKVNTSEEDNERRQHKKG